MPRGNRPGLVAVVALLALASGCLGSTGGDAGTTPARETATAPPDAAEIQAAVREATADVESYSYAISMTVETDRGTTRVNGTGVVDVDDRRLRQESTTRVTTDDGNVTLDAETILAGRTVYVRMAGDDRWHGFDASELAGGDVWNRTSTLEEQRALLEDANVSLTGTETVAGEEAYVLYVDPDPAALAQVLAADGAQQGAGRVGALDSLAVTNFTATQYVSAETMRPVRCEIRLTYEVDGRTVDVTRTITVRDYGEDVSIEVPDDANRTTERP